MKEATHTRKKHVITELGEKPRAKAYSSINAAKRESRNIQLSAGRLGCGVVQVDRT
jgi:hypothetical protein